VKSHMSIRNVARSIDKGFPLMWSMYVVMGLNDSFTVRAKKRRTVKDMEEWVEVLKPFRNAARDIKIDRGGGHVCMIIGYNATTGEIAISDSWGEAYEERWITIEEAEAISYGQFLIIDL